MLGTSDVLRAAYERSSSASLQHETHQLYCPERSVPIIDVPDIRGDDIKAFLAYLYTGEIHLSIQNAFEILYIGRQKFKHCTFYLKNSIFFCPIHITNLANKYMVKELEELCFAFLEKEMSPTMIFETLQNAIVYYNEVMIVKSLKVIEGKAEALIKDDAFLNVAYETLVTILKCDYLNIDEIDLFKRVRIF